MIAVDVQLNGRRVTLAEIGAAGIVHACVSTGGDTRGDSSAQGGLYVQGSRPGKTAEGPSWFAVENLKLGDEIRMLFCDVDTVDGSPVLLGNVHTIDGLPGAKTTKEEPGPAKRLAKLAARYWPRVLAYTMLLPLCLGATFLMFFVACLMVGPEKAETLFIVAGFLSFVLIVVVSSTMQWMGWMGWMKDGRQRSRW